MANKKRKARARPPLDERHYRAIELLVAGRLGYAEIAKKVRVDRRTLLRWRKRKDFDRELRKALDRSVSEFSRRIRERGRLRTAHDMTWYFDAIGNV